MKTSWFRPFGWIYWPIAWQGWVITILADIFVLHILLTVLWHASSVTEALYATFSFIVPTFLLWNWIASKKS